MKEHAGSRIVTLLVTALVGCASPATPDATTPAPGGAQAAKRARRPTHAAAPTVVARPSEHDAVVADAPDPEAQRLLEKRLAEAAVPLDAKPAKATELALADTARGEAADMSPLGEVVGASLKEGQRAMMPVTLAPGECATFIAEGGLGVIEVDLFLLRADRSAGLHVLAEDPGIGPIAVVGGRGHCYETPTKVPLAAEVHVTLRRGAGLVLLRGYKK
jgi:hypothetical protein